MLDISRLNGKTIETQRRYFKVPIVRLPMESCQSFCIISCSQTKIAWFKSVVQLKIKMFLKIALDVPELVPNTKNSYEFTSKRKNVKYMRIIVKVRVKKTISQCPKNNASHAVKVFLEHILWEFVTRVYSDIICWYKFFGDKVCKKLIISICKWL